MSSFIDSAFPPDLLGWNAAIDTIDKPIDVSPRDLRRLIISAEAMVLTAALLVDFVQRGEATVNELGEAIVALSAVIAQMVQVDFRSNMPGWRELSEEDGKKAMLSFFETRFLQFFTGDGRPLPYVPAGFDGDGFAGVTAK